MTNMSDVVNNTPEGKRAVEKAVKQSIADQEAMSDTQPNVDEHIYETLKKILHRIRGDRFYAPNLVAIEIMGLFNPVKRANEPIDSTHNEIARAVRILGLSKVMSDGTDAKSDVYSFNDASACFMNGYKAAEIVRTVERQAKKDLLAELLNLYGEPRCENLHHPKKWQHEVMKDCPVVAAIKEIEEGL